MPQLDSSTFFSQLTFTIVFLAILFIFMVAVVLPSIYKSQRARDLVITESELQLNVIYSMLWLTDAYKQVTSDKTTSCFDSLLDIATNDLEKFPSDFDEDCYLYGGIGAAEYDELENSDGMLEIHKVIRMIAHTFNCGISYSDDVFVDLLLDDYGLFSNVMISNFVLQMQVLQSDSVAGTTKLLPMAADNCVGLTNVESIAYKKLVDIDNFDFDNNDGYNESVAWLHNNYS